jgi:hypothetical protein
MRMWVRAPPEDAMSITTNAPAAVLPDASCYSSKHANMPVTSSTVAVSLQERLNKCLLLTLLLLTLLPMLRQLRTACPPACPAAAIFTAVEALLQQPASAAAAAEPVNQAYAHPFTSPAA